MYIPSIDLEITEDEIDRAKQKYLIGKIWGGWLDGSKTLHRSRQASTSG